LKYEDSQETLSRYIYSKNHFRISDHTAKYSAFLPPADRRLSVFKIAGLREDEIWQIGSDLRMQTLLGRADIGTAVVYITGLEIESDNNPPRHCTIVGWPEESSAIKLKAIELAERSRFHLRRDLASGAK
jgi:hypothetical protein